MEVISYYPFKILDEKQYPDLENSSNGTYTMSLPTLSKTVTIIEQWATGYLYYMVDNGMPFPLRYNTNLLNSVDGIDYSLYYSPDSQGFILESK